MADNRQLAPVGLADIAPQALAHGLDPVALVGVQAVEEGGRGLAEAIGVAQHPPQVADPLDVFLQHQPVVHARRQGRGLRLDEGIPVPVAADPGAEAEETGDAEVGLGAIDPPGDPLQASVDLGHGLEEGLAEEVEPLLDLVGDLGFVDPHLVRLPQDLDLGEDGPQALLGLLLVEAAGTQVLGQEEDAAEGFEDGAALGLRGMGGEDRQIEQTVQEALQLPGTHALRL